MVASTQVVTVDGRTLQLSNLDKVFWPKLGLTKADLLNYHVRMAPYTIPYWQNRPMTVTRYPDGVEGHFFYQKNKPTGAPSWVKTFVSNNTEYMLADDLSAITWFVNQGSIEFHPASYVRSNPNVPSFAIIDLDPTPPLGFKEAVEAAKRCQELLVKLGLRGYPKTSGGSGLHIYIPLVPSYDFQISTGLVQLLGQILYELYPRDITLERLVRNRRGVYVDYLQNQASKTIVGVYSPRPSDEATVSTPIRWNDLDYVSPQDFTIQTVPQWVQEMGDLFYIVSQDAQSLEHMLHTLKNIPH